MNLNRYFLNRSYAQGLLPFASIMDLPRAEALLLTDAYINKASDRNDDPAKRIETYYDHRIDIEDWLRGEALRQNVAVQHPHPLYFRLLAGRFDQQDPDHQPQHISIPVGEIDLASCSFTIGDSFATTAMWKRKVRTAMACRCMIGSARS